MNDEQLSALARLQAFLEQGRWQGRPVKRYRGSRTNFAHTYARADVLLVHTDVLHGTLSGLAAKKLNFR
ncbi:MAG: hypothetical protein ACRESE_05680 [Gammaproteobacteria bacterium]